MSDHNDILPDYINYMAGPRGEMVVVVKPNQEKLPEMDDVKEDICGVICAFTWGVVGIPFTIIGFALVCVGLKSEPVLTVGLIFFSLGLVTTFFFGLSVCLLNSDHRKRIRKYMHKPGRDVFVDPQPSFLSPVAEESLCLPPPPPHPIVFPDHEYITDTSTHSHILSAGSEMSYNPSPVGLREHSPFHMIPTSGEMSYNPSPINFRDSPFHMIPTSGEMSYSPSPPLSIRENDPYGNFPSRDIYVVPESDCCDGHHSGPCPSEPPPCEDVQWVRSSRSETFFSV